MTKEEVQKNKEDLLNVYDKAQFKSKEAKRKYEAYKHINICKKPKK